LRSTTRRKGTVIGNGTTSPETAGDRTSHAVAEMRPEKALTPPLLRVADIREFRRIHGCPSRTVHDR
jgi:hypothetical protein